MSLVGFFQDKGGLPAGAPSYVRRQADEQLLSVARSGGLAYILAARQTGKTSLITRTRLVLAAEDVECVYIDLSTIGAADADIDSWYMSLLSEQEEQLGLQIDVVKWWTNRFHLTPTKRFFLFMRDEVMRGRRARVVVFFDEIDSTLGLPFSADDFFAALRALHESRASDSALSRLAVVVVGVAAPSDLISDPRRTPFNVGHAIELSDISQENSTALLPGLAHTTEPEVILQRVLYWTGGHPRLTQRICSLVAIQECASPATVDAIVDDEFRSGDGQGDETLREIHRQAARDPHARKWIVLYCDVLTGRAPIVDWTSEQQIRARLVGLVSGQRNQPLRVRSRLFERVFDDAWVNFHLGRRPFNDALTRWLESKRSNDFLLRGQALVEFKAWAETQSSLPRADQDFLLAGIDDARRVAETRRAQDLRTARLTVGIGGLGVLLFATVTLFLLQSKRARELEEARDKANASQKEAEAAKDAARSSLDEAVSAREEAETALRAARIARDEADAANAAFDFAVSTFRELSEREAQIARSILDKETRLRELTSRLAVLPKDGIQRAQLQKELQDWSRRLTSDRTHRTALKNEIARVEASLRESIDARTKEKELREVAQTARSVADGLKAEARQTDRLTREVERAREDEKMARYRVRLIPEENTEELAEAHKMIEMSASHLADLQARVAQRSRIASDLQLAEADARAAASEHSSFVEKWRKQPVRRTLEGFGRGGGATR